MTKYTPEAVVVGVETEMHSLLGVLHHACQVVHPGHTFLRQIIELSKMVKLPHHHIQFNADFISDLEFLLRSRVATIAV